MVWWLRQKVTDLTLETWFHPTVDIQRSDEALKIILRLFPTAIRNGSFNQEIYCTVTLGDYLGLNTDCNNMPMSLIQMKIRSLSFYRQPSKRAIVFKIYLLEILNLAVRAMTFVERYKRGQKEGLRPSIYTHPLGSFGHSAGTTLGMWDAQGGVPGSGDYPMAYKTTYAIELNNTVFVPKWNKDVRIMLEEAGYFDQQGFRYVKGRRRRSA